MDILIGVSVPLLNNKILKKERMLFQKPAYFSGALNAVELVRAQNF